MFAGLSLDQAPPYKAPLNFFLTAPIFAIIAGIFTLFTNDFIFHDPYIIASIHLVTIGFILMTILGALQQMLPVVAGAVIPKANITANITYYSLTLGLITFAMSFFLYTKVLFFISAALLLVGLLYFTLIALYQLLKVPNKSYIVIGIIISLVFFILSFMLGIHLLIANATSNIGAFHYDFALVHYNYMFFGFLFILIVALTIQVVPMFWVASAFEKIYQAIIIFGSTVLLVLYPINLFTNLGLDLVYKIALTALVILFGIITIQKLRSRKRKLKDITVYFYITSMVFLLFGTVYWFMMSFFHLPVNLLAIIFGLGFVVSLMNGMLYKIVPFLTWFHLNAKGLFDIPSMREMIPIKNMQRQFYMHLSSMLCLVAGFGLNLNIVIKLAVILFIVSNLLLFINIYKTVQVYLKNENRDPFGMGK
ncbi:hypothetical protein OAR97_08200 [Arcobacteraceae bacterium]|nr:hypothetical protein [Arcobacteraceae bacterium]